MKNLALARNSLTLACATCLAILMGCGSDQVTSQDGNQALSRKGKDQEPTEATVPAPSDSPRTSPSSDDSSSMVTCDNGMAESRLPPSTEVQSVVESIEKLAKKESPVSKAYAKHLSIVLAKHGVDLPKALSSLVAAKTGVVEPSAAEIHELGEDTAALANTCWGVGSSITIDDPQLLQVFCADLLVSMVETCPSNAGRMAAMFWLGKMAEPGYSAEENPRALIDPHVAAKAFATALDHALDTSSGSFSDDSAEAIFAFSFDCFDTCLTVEAMSLDDDEGETIDPFIETLIAKTEKASQAKAFEEGQEALGMLLSRLKDARGSGPFYAADIAAKREIKEFVEELVAAINAEDKRKLTKLMSPGVAQEIAEAKSLRDAWSELPNTKLVSVRNVGPILRQTENSWRVTVNLAFRGEDGRSGKGQFEALVVRTDDGWRVQEEP